MRSTEEGKGHLGEEMDVDSANAGKAAREHRLLMMEVALLKSLVKTSRELPVRRSSLVQKLPPGGGLLGFLNLCG